MLRLQVEQGSKNHELVPVSLIAQLSGSRSGGVNKGLGELAKRKLVAKMQNAKYEGYRLTYGGYDFLACRTFAKRDTVFSVGNQIGTGKESDIYVVADEEGVQRVMKIHRLGRISFRAIKSKRDYLRTGQSASWMYMSRLAAIKEYAFMTVLFDHGFPVPRPIDQSRHCIIMELIDAFPLRQIVEVPSPGSLYSQLMDLIVRLARSGLIHGDFNEFNILVRDHRSDREKNRMNENPERRQERIDREGGDFELVLEEEDITEERRAKGVLEVVVIDFPQMVSTDHVDAEYYFNRDVACVRTFFARRFKYESAIYPRFATIMKDGVREFDLDVEVAASGFSKGERQVLEAYMAEIVEENEDEEEEEEEHSDDEEEDEEEEDSTPHDPLTLENLHLNPSLHLPSTSDSDDESASSHSNSGTETGAHPSTSSVAGRSEDGISTVFGQRSRRRPHVPRTTPNVEEIVTDRLKRNLKSSEKKHHGKKPVTSGVLGRMKGSKMRSDSRRNIKESQDF